jgi:hypothetical protein
MMQLLQLLIQFHDTLVTIACLSLLPFIEYRKQGDSSHYLHTRMPHAPLGSREMPMRAELADIPSLTSVADSVA